nr:DUF1667 domain-containing protein [Maliibacterium massiliense]
MSMEKEASFVCIACPVGCHLHVARDAQGALTVTGNTCKRGESYAKSEFTKPVRVVTYSVPVKDGEMPLVSVKTATPVPKARISQVLLALRALRAEAPVMVGDVLLADVAGTGVDIVATRNVAKRRRAESPLLFG